MYLCINSSSGMAFIGTICPLMKRVYQTLSQQNLELFLSVHFYLKLSSYEKSDIYFLQYYEERKCDDRKHA